MSEAAVGGASRTAPICRKGPPSPAAGVSVPEVSIAPYAVIRQTMLSLPKSSTPADHFRVRLERMLRLTSWSALVSSELSDILYKEIASAPPQLRTVLLPLRRDVHNQRGPRLHQPALIADLAERTPLLRRWLDTRAEIDQLGVELDELAESALRADRAALAEMCHSEALCRAVALTSEDLLHAVRRAAAQGDRPDRRARKSEATVLRYAVRAATKTNPLSWFTRVSWGWWPESADTFDRDRRADTGAPDTVLAVAQADRATLTTLVHAVLNRPDLRGDLRYQLAPGIRTEDGRIFFHRPASADDTPSGLAREEEVSLPLTKPLRQVIAVLRGDGPVPPRVLVAAIADRLPGPRQAAVRAAEPYVRQLIDQRLLTPTFPIDPQDTEALAAVARWLDRLGLADAAALLRQIDAQTSSFAQTPAAGRPAALARITALWDEAFLSVGAASAARRRTPVTEDITCPAPLPLGTQHGRDVHPDLVRLAPLLEIFDQHAVFRRLARDRFVARFGVGGTCHSLAVFAPEYDNIWRDLEFLEANGKIDPAGTATFGPELRELARLRRELVEAVSIGEADAEIILPEHIVRAARRGLPRWLQGRPISYSVFAQPVPGETDETRLCLNHIYGGWGRFTSRFLHYFGSAATAAVATQIRRGIGQGSRVVQIRPVSGFNGNLHPLLMDEEIAADGTWGRLLPEDLELVHDPGSDQLRLRVPATGEFLDVLYLGSLVAVVLPQRLTDVLHDHESGYVDLPGVLVPRQHRDTALGTVTYRPRLRYRNLILSRAQWRLPPAMVRAWRGDLDQEAGIPARATIRWRQELDLPQRLFVSAAPPEDAKGLKGFLSYFEEARSQYVDLGSALHLRSLSRTLARYPHGVILEEALPEPRPGTPAVEVMTEIYRSVT